jgi:monofunctional glycosyltransferase
MRSLFLVSGALIAALLIVSLIYRFVPPASTLMLARWITFQPVERDWKPLSDISPRLVRAVVLAEDARFCLHNGVDWRALRHVVLSADEDGPSRGASTLTMQTAKNLFLWHGRSYVRKGLELPLAIWLELVWPKDRVLEVYLNIAEWGDGVFGAEMASQKSFNKKASDLTFREAALLARALPNPLQRSAGKADGAQQARAASLLGRLIHETADLSCLSSG